jgi:hypothetical protein
MQEDDWDKQMERLDEKTAQRRAKAKQLDEAIQEESRRAEERRHDDKPAD